MNTETSRGAQLQLDVISGERKLEQFSELLDQAFQVPASAHFLDDFPIWGGTEPKKSVIRAGVFAQAGRLAGCAAARIARLNAPTGSLPIGIIGAVATDPLYRGRGVASETVRFLLKWLSGEKVAMTILWGQETEFYSKLGFRPFGAQTMIPLSEFASSIQESPADGPIHRGWIDGIFTRLRERKTGLAHAQEDLSWIREHRNVQWYWNGPAECPDAYLAVNRGIDLQGLVHEWGGNGASLKQLVNTAAIDNPELRILGSPEVLGKTRQESDCQPLGLGVVHDAHAIIRAYGIGPDRVPGGPEEVLKDARTLFGEPGSEGLPIWFWGLDSA